MDDKKLDRFCARINITDDDCWLWQGRPHVKGYGRFDGQYAHRFMLIHVLNRNVPAGMQVDHRCHVRMCVRPDHLEIVTPIENNHRRRNVHTECPTCGRAY